MIKLILKDGIQIECMELKQNDQGVCLCAPAMIAMTPISELTFNMNTIILVAVFDFKDSNIKFWMKDNQKHPLYEIFRAATKNA